MSEKGPYSGDLMRARKDMLQARRDNAVSPVDFDDYQVWLTADGDLTIIGPTPAIDITIPADVLKELGLTIMKVRPLKPMEQEERNKLKELIPTQFRVELIYFLRNGEPQTPKFLAWLEEHKDVWERLLKVDDWAIVLAG